MKKQYHYPQGYSLLQTTLKTSEFLKHPINFITKSMEQFGDTYTATVGTDKIILTKNPEFINHILRENHKNYMRSDITAKRGAQFFGKGLLFSNGAYWLKQRRLIQPAFHRSKIKGLYGNIQQTIEDYLIDFPIGEEIDVYPIMHDLSFRVLIKSLFEIDLSKEVMAELNQIFGELSNFLMKDVNMPIRKLFYPFTGEERTHLKTATDAWTDKYIFPGGILPTLAQVAKASEHHFYLRDLHNFGGDYDTTLLAWYDNFHKSWAELEGYDERFYRMWRYFLLSAAGGFRANRNALWQFVFSKKNYSSHYKAIR